MTRPLTPLRCVRGSDEPCRRHSSISVATNPVQPVWCDAPSPAPVSPLKYS